LARLARLALHVLRGLAIAGFVFPAISEARRRQHIRRWSRQLLAIFNVRLHVHRARARARGAAAPAAPMIVANHISWIDPFVIDAVMPARFVAKSEIARWPLVGWLSARAGTVFIQRARRRDTARINDRVTNALRAGAVMAVFPEGTTTDGSRVLHFHSSLLQPAVAGLALHGGRLRGRLVILGLRAVHGGATGDIRRAHAARAAR
jgi:1-acyl-sn-glycerol-3-phosphate acyltransferase